MDGFQRMGFWSEESPFSLDDVSGSKDTEKVVQVIQGIHQMYVQVIL